MLMDLNRNLVKGTTVDIALQFRSGAAMRVDFPVIDRVDRPDVGSG